MLKKPFAINTLLEGSVEHQITDKLKLINDLLVSHEVDEITLRNINTAMQQAADHLQNKTFEKRQRTVAQQSLEGEGFDYGSGNSHAFRPISGLCNVVSPRVQYFYEDDELAAYVKFTSAYEGPPGFVHGGYVAAVMDEIFGFCQSKLDDPYMTGTLELKYLMPVPLNQQLKMTSQVERVEGRKAFLTAQMVDHNNKILIEGKAIFIKIDPKLYASFTQSNS